MTKNELYLLLMCFCKVGELEVESKKKLEANSGQTHTRHFSFHVFVSSQH